MLSPSTAWKEAIERADVRPRMLVEIYDGSNTWKAVSGSMDVGSDLRSSTVPVAIRSVDPLAIELDPFTRAVEFGEIHVEADDAWLRPIIVNNRLKGQRVNISFGAAELDEADFVAFATNSMVEEVEPLDEHSIKLVLMGQIKMLADVMVRSAYWVNKHPLECLYKGDGTGILEKGGAHTFDTNAFDRTQLEYDSIDHVIVGRARVVEHSAYAERAYVYENSRLLYTKPASSLELARSVARLINGYLLENESGELTIARYDASGSAVDDWTANDIIPGSFRQEVLDSNVINEIVCNFGAALDDPQKLRSKYVAKDSASQSTYAFPGEATRILAEEFDTRWVGAWQRLYTDITAGAASLILSGPSCYAVSGNRADMTIDADHPVYLLLDSAALPGINNLEIVKATGLTRSSTFQGDVTIHSAGDYNNEGPFSAHLTFSSVSRAQRGTSASAHKKIGTTVLDITALVLLTDELLTRFADGCPIIELETPITKYAVQIGDLVTVTWPAYLAYGKDGVTSSSKWEVITKEVDVFANPPMIRWRLAHAFDHSPSLTSDVYSTPSEDDLDEANAQNPHATQWAVLSGLGITQDAGRNVEIASGYATNGIRIAQLLVTHSKTFTASKDTYVYLDIGRHRFARIMYKETALGAGDPGTEPNELFLGKVVTGAATISSIDTDDVKTKTVKGDQLVDESVDTAAVADEAVAPTCLSYVTLGEWLNANAGFGSRSRG